MKMAAKNDTKVWAKGDKCLSPYTGDSKLYSGIIKKLRRSPKGDVFALVKFDGYNDDESEEVVLTQLQEVKSKDKPSRSNSSYEADGMFKPLQGGELDSHFRAKYEAEDDEESEISVKREMLSQVLFEKKSKNTHGAGKSKGSQSTCSRSSRKSIVAVGGEAVGEKSKPKSRQRTASNDDDDNEETRSPSVQRRYQLDVTGGAALDPRKELLTTKPLSDISSIVHPEKVKRAFIKERDSPRPEEDTSCDSGFDDEDMEKPRFTSTPSFSKVPFVLSDPDESQVIQVPATLNQYLRDYQREGIKFLYGHYKLNRGAILGDDMGLGKTVQVIGFLSALLGKQGNRVDVMRQKPKFIRELSEPRSKSTELVPPDPFLIIGPGCVLYNWLEEFQTWGYFTVRKFHGTDKQECLSDVRKGKVEVVVTTFETFREHQNVLNEITWSAVIADEVHKIKGLKAQTTKALRGIHTQRRFGLTGTALQNNLLEFWSILDWAQPGCLGRLVDFDDEYVKPIEVGQRHDANKRELALARRKKEKFASVRRDMMIRRTKAIISDQLPRKDDSVVFCKLSRLQVTMYQTILRHKDMSLILHMADPCPCDSGKPQSKCCYRKTKDGQSVRALMFTFMHLLLKVSNHVALLIPREKTSEKQARSARQICKAAFQEHPEFMVLTKEASFQTLSDPKYCGKMKILQGLLKVFEKEHSKVLLFSYSTQVLDILEQYLMSTGYEYRRIDGSVSPKKRMVIVREYNTDPNLFICLISTKAGGLGLNLTGANKVVIFDPNWNPTHDLQAQDRAYRIGQRRNVQVYRLISAGTIEENMYLRQIYKQQLLNVTVEDENSRRYFYAVQGNPRQKGELFGIKNMFQLRTGESCLTMDILKRNQRVETVLAGCEMAKYIPPVMRVEEEDDDWEDETPGLNVSETDEELFEEFFASQGTEEVEEAIEEPDKAESDSERTGLSKNRTIKHTGRDNKYKKSESTERRLMESSDSSSNEDSFENVRVETKQKPTKVRFQDNIGESRPGKVRPSQSRTGKGSVKRSKKEQVEEDDIGQQGYDQTLAGTFDDVSDVFDHCGVVHIHKNVKVVGGSKAEDHMTKCAITDVYELHQNSQDLAVQCEPMSESSEEEENIEKTQKKKTQSEDHNSPRSVMVNSKKVLIGQTPKFFRRRHFDALCKYHGSQSATEFAEFVLKSTLLERIKLLNQYYENTDVELKDILQYHTPKTEEIKKTFRARKAKPETTTNKKRKRFLKPPQTLGVSFTDNLEGNPEETSPASLENQYFTTQNNPYSQTLGSLELSVPLTGDEVDGSNFYSRNVKEKVGPRSDTVLRNVAPPKAKTKHRVKETARGHTDYVDLLDDIGDFSDEENINSKKDNDSASVDDLLFEMGRYSEENMISYSNENVIENSTDKKLESFKVNCESKLKKAGANTEILDDLFGGAENSKAQKKPAPSKRNMKESEKKTAASKQSTTRRGDFDSFKEVDEIFNTSADSASEASETFLETSTLKDDGFDCFSDPTKWKQRKRKTPDKRNLVDRLIGDSEAEYNEYFTSGRLKKKEVKYENKEKGRNDSIEEYDGSMSLF